MNIAAIPTDQPREGKKTRDDDPGNFLHPTYFMDFEHPEMRAFAESKTDGAQGDVEKAVALFYAVRDGIRYNPYELKIEPPAYRASHTLQAKVGWCVPKGVLMAAAARAVGIPARPGYADVLNHLATERFKEMMSSCGSADDGSRSPLSSISSCARSSACCPRSSTAPAIPCSRSSTPRGASTWST